MSVLEEARVDTRFKQNGLFQLLDDGSERARIVPSEIVSTRVG